MKKETLAVVNGVDIICFTNTEEKLMPIKPICDALGVDYDAEISRVINETGFGETLEDFNDGEWEENGTKAMPIMYALGFAGSVSFAHSYFEDVKVFTNYKLQCHQAIINFIKNDFKTTGK